jgi:hypothetical protein
MLKINRKLSEGDWIEYDEDKSVSFKIKPISYLKTDFNKAIEDPEYALETTFGIVVDWDGVLGEDGKPLPYNRENLTFIFSHSPRVTHWIQVKAIELADEAAKIVKN